MLSKLWRFFEKIESDKTPLVYWFISLFAIIAIRNLLEGILEKSHWIVAPRPFFIDFPVAYVMLFLALAILLKLITRAKVSSLIKVLVVLFSLILIVPIIDFAASGGEGLHIKYLAGSAENIAKNFVTYYSDGGATIGERVEGIVFGLLLLLYVYIKTKSVAKAAVGIFLAYCAVFVFAALGPLAHGFAHFFFGAPTDALSGTYGNGLYEAYKVGLLVTLFISFIVAIELALLLAISKRQKFILLLKAIRPVRSAHYLLLSVFGILLGISATGSWKFGFYGIFAFGYVVSVFFAYQFACLINDFFDRDLHMRIKSKQSDGDWRTVKQASMAYLALALIMGYTIGYETLIFLACSAAVAFLYSAPPLKLKRYPIVASLALAVCALLVILGGFAVFARDKTVELFPQQVAIVVLLVYTLGTNYKDLKDARLDKENKVYTIPVLLGEKKGKITIAIMTALSFLVVPFILNTPDLIIPSVIGSLLSAVFIARNADEKIFRTMHLCYFVLVMYYLI